VTLYRYTVTREWWGSFTTDDEPDDEVLREHALDLADMLAADVVSIEVEEAKA